MTDADALATAPPEIHDDVDAWTRRLPGPLRRLTDRYLPRGATVLTVLTVAYFVVRQVQNRVLANTFGLGTDLDVYYASVRLPEVALDLLVAAGLTAPFVPIFTALRRDHDEANGDHDANEFGQTVLTGAVLVMAIASIGLIAAAPLIADAVAGSLQPPERALYVDLFRINCLTLVLFAASIAIGEILVANRRFFFYALAPVLYPLGAILGTLLFAGTLGIYAPAWGTVAGAVAHLAARVAGSFQTSFRIRPRLQVQTDAFREFFRLMLPRMVSYPLDPIQTAYFAALALSFGPGSASALTFADDYRAVPVILIAQQFSLAAFPALSAAFAGDDRPGFRSVLRRNVVSIGALTVIAAVLLAILAPALIHFLLRGGAFDASDVALTASLLTAFAVSVPFDGLTYPLARGLYATHNTVLAVLASLAGLAVIVGVSQALAASLGIFSIPAAYAAGSAVKAGLLAAFLAWRLGRIEAAAASV